MVEREVKIRVDDPDALHPLLEAMGAARSRSEQELNRMFDTPEGTLRRRGEVLRVRTADHASLTWKGPAAEADHYKHKVREELEAGIAAEGAESLVAMLARLGFHETLRYQKRRETWHWQGVTIALDQLEFGHFVEIEGDATVIQDALRLLRLEHEPLETRGYPEL
ncbi:MAG TPA: class IV adenylate cyclase, partial [Chloroflexota bacterium]|nr:class IV adenylate cyclase [Chloroflexota bacterium]